MMKRIIIVLFAQLIGISIYAQKIQFWASKTFWDKFGSESSDSIAIQKAKLYGSTHNGVKAFVLYKGSSIVDTLFNCHLALDTVVNFEIDGNVLYLNSQKVDIDKDVLKSIKRNKIKNAKKNMKDGYETYGVRAYHASHSSHTSHLSHYSSRL